MRKLVFKVIPFVVYVLLSFGLAAQTNEPKIIRFTSPHTSFPDTGRKNGHMYHDVLYDAATHYSDSSVILIVPPDFSAKEKVDLVFWFHGWSNDIDSSNINFELGKQFIASHRNAILVFAETTKRAPDSYGGKLEQPGMFSLLVDDILNKLKHQKVIASHARAGNITLAGHSGGYRVIAYILQNGKLPVHEVYLFDALYSEQPKFMNWIKEDPKNIFIDLFTDVGGTDSASYEFMDQMQKENIPFIRKEEATITADEINNNRIIFIHSLHAHNDIIKNPDNFEMFLTLKNGK